MQEFNTQELNKIYKEHWRPGWGSIAVDEVLFVQSLIQKHRPDGFVEIGMASGLSTGLIAQMLDWTGGHSLASLDYDNTFFGDKTKPNGFLVEKIYGGKEIAVDKKPFKISLDIEEMGLSFDMAFIDANHQHPWPTIDTLGLYPFIKGPKIVIHHDLCLFRNQDVLYGIGPKYLHDQFPESSRIESKANLGNIFAVKLDALSSSDIERIAGDSFCLPWSLRTPLATSFIARLKNFLNEHYSESLGEHFEKCAGKFNLLERLRTGV